MTYGNFNFSNTSEERMDTIHSDLRVILREALKESMIDFGVAVGRRTVEEQKEIYASGRTKEGPILTYKDGVNDKSQHNYSPSRAVDVYAWVNGGITWQEKYYIYLGGVITAVASRLYKEGKVKHKIRWGGNFDQDHDILDKGSFIDLPHYELIM